MIDENKPSKLYSLYEILGTPCLLGENGDLYASLTSINSEPKKIVHLTH